MEGERGNRDGKEEKGREISDFDASSSRLRQTRLFHKLRGSNKARKL